MRSGICCLGVERRVTEKERKEKENSWREGHWEFMRDLIGHAKEFRLDLEVIQPLSDTDTICLFSRYISHTSGSKDREVFTYDSAEGLLGQIVRIQGVALQSNSGAHRGLFIYLLSGLLGLCPSSLFIQNFRFTSTATWSFRMLSFHSSQTSIVPIISFALPKFQWRELMVAQVAMVKEKRKLHQGANYCRHVMESAGLFPEMEALFLQICSWANVTTWFCLIGIFAGRESAWRRPVWRWSHV